MQVQTTPSTSLLQAHELYNDETIQTTHFGAVNGFFAERLMGGRM